MSKELKKYLNPFSLKWIFISIGLCLLAAGFIYIAVSKPGDNSPALIVVLLCIAAPVVKLLMTLLFFFRMKDDPRVPDLELEFLVAIPMRNDSLRLGETYIFMKNSGRILTYSEITQVYQYIHKTNGVEDAREIHYVDINNRKRKLCKLQLRGASDDELVTIIGFILSKNPDVKVGYR